MKKRNPVLLFNIFYWFSCFSLYLPQFFFTNGFFSKSGVTWYLLLGTNIFSFIEPVYYLWILYGMLFTSVMLSTLIVLTKNRMPWARAAVFIIYLALNTAVNVVLTDW